MAVKLHYEVGGKGPAVVLLHPVGLDGTFLEPIAARLRSDFTVVVVDQRGHGQSLAAEPAGSLEAYADDLHALIGALKIAPAAVVGFSFGGMVAQTLALKYPADVSALLPCACPGTLPAATRDIARARGDDARQGGMGAVLEATLDRWFTPSFRAAGKDAPTRKRLLSLDVEGWAQAWHAMAQIDALPQLGVVRVPTLCVAGELDKSAPPAAVKAIADAIPGARYAELPGAPHMIFIEQPDETARVIGAFLRKVLKPGAAR